MRAACWNIVLTATCPSVLGLLGGVDVVFAAPGRAYELADFAFDAAFYEV
jgi:hypothetical protein